MKSVSLNTKLLAALAVAWIGLLVLAGSAAFATRTIMLKERKSEIRSIVEAATAVVSDLAARADRHEISIDEAKRQAMARLEAIRYGSDGYVVILTSHPAARVLMHPFLKDILNKDVSNIQDPSGKALFVAQIRAAEETGEGYAEFIGRVRDESGYKYQTKIAFVKKFEPWDWYIDSGLYIADVAQAFRTTLIEYLVFVVAIGACMSSAMLLISRSVQKSLGCDPALASSIADRIANGDLTASISADGADQSSLLYSMKRMQERLTATIGKMIVSADAIATATEQIATGNNDLSQRTEEQATSLEETAASMDQLTSTVRSNAESALHSHSLAQTASQVAQRGGEVVGRVVTTMRSIASSSARVAEISAIIEGISFQTNILALNAAVEAARAGEQGRGFAVVAGEVRNLAQRSATAVKEIKELITESGVRIDAGAKLVKEAIATIDEVVSSANRVSGIVAEISTASEEQRIGIEQVNQAIIQMDHVTQQNAALVEQAAAASAELAEQTQQLREAATQFTINHLSNGA
ncbi:hypothetical protein WL74_29255 [Burkholderia cepacia]|uniref:methyl-accepting chemotaxis protein n=1 Tax=Burkholderia cepacia TaxID=292 RepID=UPI000754B4EA|nr:methyl-accepting chemotaxis protein [Burkholderia cepacia]KVR68980.1 hypothetical protein WK21_19800 [Burkholderia cepacia]KWE18326.1 hypothetical protein WL74_29255 [Burkholderia cepacia]